MLSWRSGVPSAAEYSSVSPSFTSVSRSPTVFELPRPHAPSGTPCVASQARNAASSPPGQRAGGGRASPEVHDVTAERRAPRRRTKLAVAEGACRSAEYARMRWRLGGCVSGTTVPAQRNAQQRAPVLSCASLQRCFVSRRAPFFRRAPWPWPRRRARAAACAAPAWRAVLAPAVRVALPARPRQGCLTTLGRAATRSATPSSASSRRARYAGARRGFGATRQARDSSGRRAQRRPARLARAVSRELAAQRGALTVAPHCAAAGDSRGAPQRQEPERRG